MAYSDMTPTALACRADEIDTDYVVSDFLRNGDERELTIYFAWVDCEIDWTDYSDSTPGTMREIIGATAGEDVLTRDELRALLGDRAVAEFETAWEYAR